MYVVTKSRHTYYRPTSGCSSNISGVFLPYVIRIQLFPVHFFPISSSQYFFRTTTIPSLLTLGPSIVVLSYNKTCLAQFQFILFVVSQHNFSWSLLRIIILYMSNCSMIFQRMFISNYNNFT